jgi:hypothetical protein
MHELSSNNSTSATFTIIAVVFQRPVPYVITFMSISMQILRYHIDRIFFIFAERFTV